MKQAPLSQRGKSDQPPLSGSRWNCLYLLVLVELAALVLLFDALTQWAS